VKLAAVEIAILNLGDIPEHGLMGGASIWESTSLSLCGLEMQPWLTSSELAMKLPRGYLRELASHLEAMSAGLRLSWSPLLYSWRLLTFSWALSLTLYDG